MKKFLCMVAMCASVSLAIGQNTVGDSVAIFSHSDKHSSPIDYASEKQYTITRRYRDIVFRQLKIDTVVYTTHRRKHLLMDVYQPMGDTAQLRPLLILAH